MLNTNKMQSDINTLCQKYSDYSLDHYTKDPDLILNTDPDTLLCDYGSLETDTDRQAFASFCGQLAQLGMKTGQFALAKSFAEKSFALEPRDDVQALLEKAQLYTDMTTEINEFYTKFRGNNLETPVFRTPQKKWRWQRFFRALAVNLWCTLTTSIKDGSTTRRRWHSALIPTKSTGDTTPRLRRLWRTRNRLRLN